MGQEVPGDSVGDEFKGYIFKITGGNDKQGFPMKQGVMHPSRVRLLLSKGHSCYRPRRDGERKRKSVRGCIVGPDLAVLSLVIVKQGEDNIPGLTDVNHPNRLGPKRATKIRRFFGLSKEDDVSTYYTHTYECVGLLNEWFRSENMLFAVRCSQRTHPKSHTPRPQEFRGSLLLNDSSISDTGLPSKGGGLLQPRMLRYVFVCSISMLGSLLISTLFPLYRQSTANSLLPVFQKRRASVRKLERGERAL